MRKSVIGNRRRRVYRDAVSIYIYITHCINARIKTLINIAVNNTFDSVFIIIIIPRLIILVTLGINRKIKRLHAVFKSKNGRLLDKNKNKKKTKEISFHKTVRFHRRTNYNCRIGTRESYSTTTYRSQ